jgi:multiple sugar transport system substrate-binding protein
MGISRRHLLQTSTAFAAFMTLPQWARAQGIALTTYNWGTPEEGEAYAKAFARFSAANAGITVTDNLIPLTTWSDYADGLVTQIAGGNVPDIINIAIEGVRLAVDKGLLEPLDDMIAASPKAQELLAKIPQQLKDALSVDGKLYEIPNGWQCMVIHYNKAVFDAAGVAYPQAGWTWDDFLTTCKALTSGEGATKVYGYGMPWFNFAHYPWFLTNDTYPISDDMSASNMTDPKMIEAAQFLADMVHVHGVSPDPIGLNVFDMFANGSLAMISAGRWPVPGWVASGFTTFDVAPWPRKETGNTVFGCAGWGISPSSANKQAAFDAIMELVSLETVSEIMNFGQQIPIYKEAAESETFLAAPDNAELFYQVISETRPVAAPVYFSQLDRILARAMDTMITQAETPADAFAIADQELTQAISKG